MGCYNRQKLHNMTPVALSLEGLTERPKFITSAAPVAGTRVPAC